MASKDKKQLEKRDDSTKSEIMHRLKTHPFLFIGTVVVLVIVVIAFVFVPAIVPSAYGAGDLTFGYYNRTPVRYAQNNFFYQTFYMLSQRQQQSPDEEDFMTNMAQLWRAAFEETVVRLGILDEMKQARYVVPNDVVDRRMAELPHFVENGRFSSAKYRAMDRNSRMTLWRQVQEDITVGTYLSDLTGLKSAPYEASFISSMASPKRNFEVAILSLNSYPQSELVSFAASNTDLFRAVRLSRITITSSEREARQILASIKNGTTTFEEAAINNSQDWAADRGGDIGTAIAYELGYDISDEAARERVINMGRGEISDVVKVTSGWALYRVNEPVRPVDMDDVSQFSRVRNYVNNFMRGHIEDWLISEAEKFSSQVREVGFEEAIGIESMIKNSFGPIPVNYGNSSFFSSIRSCGVPELENAGYNQFFWKAAFSTPLNSPSAPLVIDNNVVVLFPTEEILADEDEASYIESYYSYWMSIVSQNDYRTYFLTNKKLDDRFQETFQTLWRTN